MATAQAVGLLVGVGVRFVGQLAGGVGTLGWPAWVTPLAVMWTAAGILTHLDVGGTAP